MKFSMGSEKLNLQDTVVEGYSIERNVEEIVLDTGLSVNIMAKYLAGVDLSSSGDWIVEKVNSENDDIVIARNAVNKINLWGKEKGETIVTAKVYDEDNINNIVVVKIPVTVTDSVYNK